MLLTYEKKFFDSSTSLCVLTKEQLLEKCPDIMSNVQMLHRLNIYNRPSFTHKSICQTRYCVKSFVKHRLYVNVKFRN